MQLFLTLVAREGDLPFGQLHSDFREFSSEVYYFMKSTVAEMNSDMGMWTNASL